MPTLCLVADGCAKSAASLNLNGCDQFDAKGRICDRPTSHYNATLSLRLSAYHLLHFSFLRSASVLAGLQWMLGLALLPRSTFNFFAFVLAKSLGICHQSGYFPFILKI